MSAIDQIKSKYDKLIVQRLQEVCEEAKKRGFACSGPDEFSDDEYQWTVSVHPVGDEEEGAEATIILLESETRDGSEGGTSFSLEVVSHGGEILGGMTPFNKTPNVWVEASDKKAVAERWRVFDDGWSPSDVVDSMEQHIGPQRAQASQARKAIFDTFKNPAVSNPRRFKRRLV